MICGFESTFSEGGSVFFGGVGDDFGERLWLCLVKGREMCYAGGHGQV